MEKLRLMAVTDQVTDWSHESSAACWSSLGCWSSAETIRRLMM